MENKDVKREILATEQRRMRMTKLMAEAYRERVKRLETEISKLEDQNTEKSQQNAQQSDAANLLHKESAVLSPILTSIENSLEKQARFISEIDDKMQRKVNIPKDLIRELEGAHAEPRNGLVFACSLSLSAVVLVVRALCAQLF